MHQLHIELKFVINLYTMKKITLILFAFYFITTFLNAQNNDVKTYFNDQIIGGIASNGEIIWVGVDSLLVKMDKITGETISYKIPVSNEYNDKDRHASSISINKNGLLWVTCNGPLPYLETFNGYKNWNEIPLPNPWFSGLIIDKDNKVWGSTIVGLFNYEGTDWIYYNASNSSITTLAFDNENNKWLGLTPLGLGTAPGYLGKFDGSVFNIYNSDYLNGIGGNIWSIDISSSGIVWMGTFGNGLVKYNGTNWEVFNSTNSEIPQGWIKYVTIEEDNIIWFSTESGLTRFDGEIWQTFNTENSMLPSNTINSILIDENGTKWVGTDKGLISFAGKALSTSENQFSEVKYKLFPNPAKDYINIKTQLVDEASIIEIYNIVGKSVKKLKTSSNYNSIDISDLANGLYILSIKSSNGITVQKFVKNK